VTPGDTPAGHAPAPWSPTRLWARVMSGYLGRWVVLGVLIGVAAGLGSILFVSAIRLATHLFLEAGAGFWQPLPRSEAAIAAATGPHRRWLFPALVGLGGLLSGLIVYTLAPEAEGHGTDAAIRALHARDGRIRARIPAVKLAASAITIGSGGSAGREGPTAQIAAGFASWLGDRLHLDAQDRRTAIAVGIGAGIGSIFKAPLGGAILGAEVPYRRDFEPGAIIPGFIASAIGFTIFAAWSGFSPVFGNSAFTFTHPPELIWYTLLGIACGVVGRAYVFTFYWTRDRFAALPVPPHVKPAIAGVAVGLIALALPEVLGTGYGWLQIAIDGDTARLAYQTMALLIVAKIVVTSLTVGSGGSGGVFAPGLVIGGALGGAGWALLSGHVPALPPTAGPFVIVGMMALFGGIANAPVAVTLMVVEMTGELTMVVPAMLAASMAYVVSGQSGIYENQVDSREGSPSHVREIERSLHERVSVADVMRPDPVTIVPTTSLDEAERLMEAGRLRALPVVERGRLVGMFTLLDALRAREGGATTAGETMSRDPVVAYTTESVRVAHARMTAADVLQLPVIDPARPDRVAGLIDLEEIAGALDEQ
jgi:CIC family chloride channel protein